MKKVLIAPLLFVTMIVLIIWVIYPLYTKDPALGGGIKEKRALLVEKETKLSKVDAVMQNAEILYAQIGSNSADTRLLFDYVSKNREEEKLIESINALAKGEELFVINISVTDVNNSGLPDLEYAQNSISAVSIAPDGTADPASDPARLAWEEMKKERSTPRELAVKVLVVGEYAKIKSFINQMYGFKRFNQLSSLGISSSQNESGEATNLLQANMTFEFNYVRALEKISDFDIEDPVFGAQTFDMTALKAVREKSVDVRQVELRQDGTANPFFK